MATGYEAVDASFAGNYWGGLEYNGANSLLDGSVSHGNWWYAVGCSVQHGAGIPGPDSTVVQKVELYSLYRAFVLSRRRRHDLRLPVAPARSCCASCAASPVRGDSAPRGPGWPRRQKIKGRNFVEFPVHWAGVGWGSAASWQPWSRST